MRLKLFFTPLFDLMFPYSIINSNYEYYTNFIIIYVFLRYKYYLNSSSPQTSALLNQIPKRMLPRSQQSNLWLSDIFLIYPHKLYLLLSNLLPPVDLGPCTQ